MPDSFVSLPTLWALLLLALGAVGSLQARKLTLAGAAAGFVCGGGVYAGAGFTGLAMLALFFVGGTWATGFRRKDKEKKGLSEKGSSRRHAGQVIANAGVPALCGVVAFLFPPYREICSLMMAAALSSAAADTLSSELGNVWGTKYYNILTLRKDVRGLDGVVSVEGTACGAVGSMAIAFVFSLGFGFAVNAWLLIILAGTFGNLFDSVLGASLERKRLLQNDAVNFINTLAAAVLAGLFYHLL